MFLLFKRFSIANLHMRKEFADIGEKLYELFTSQQGFPANFLRGWPRSPFPPWLRQCMIIVIIYFMIITVIYYISTLIVIVVVCLDITLQ